MPPIIEVRNLTKRYRRHVAVDGIDLEVHEGEIFGILGPNGAGKTTTLEMIEGLRKPDAGTITVDGIDAVNDSNRVRKIIGVQLQSTALFPYLTASELIALFASFYGVPEPRKRAPELLRLVNLEDKANSRVEELSGGQQQRLSIALALVNTPRVTFLDEPTTGLDPHARRAAWDTIRGLRALGKTVLLTTHYLDEAQALADRVGIIKDGRLLVEGAPADLGTGAARYRVAYRLDGSDFEHVTPEPTELLHELTARALAGGQRLEGLSVTRPTLEDVYLELTTEAAVPA